MMTYRSTLLLVTCAIYLGFADPAKSTVANSVGPPSSLTGFLEISQANPAAIAERPTLRLGNRGSEVTDLQQTLQRLGYYSGAINGSYDPGTEAAVSAFQQSFGLRADGVVGATTWKALQAAQVLTDQAANEATPTPSPAGDAEAQSTTTPSRPWWLMVFIAMAAIGGGLFYLGRRSHQASKRPRSKAVAHKELVNSGAANAHHSRFLPDTHSATNNHHSLPVVPVAEPLSKSEAIAYATTETVTGDTTRLPKVNIVDELIKDLQSPDPTKRRKAIWELGQRGDSQAVQPLVNLLVEADSQQRSLILTALSEIGTRTLKPMNRALAISLQDASPEVRKNAIRDLTRVYDLISQVTQLLRYAVDDPDKEVRETAHWALGQLNRMRAASGMDDLPALQNSVSPPEIMPEELS